MNTNQAPKLKTLEKENTRTSIYLDIQVESPYINPNPKFGGWQIKTVWFKPWRWIYRPISWQGILATLVALAFCIQVFIAVDRNSRSVSDTLYDIFPYVVPALMLLYWVASKTSKD